jgi:hypothetical protein
MAEDKPEKPRPLTEFEQVELEYKRELIEDMRETRRQREEKQIRMRLEQKRRAADAAAELEQRERRKRVCKHRKGGKNNNFAKGNGSDRSIIVNTYPMGTVVIMCTRCATEWMAPDSKLKKANPAEYKRQLMEWQEVSQWPTDNMPSGGQIFLKTAAA